MIASFIFLALGMLSPEPALAASAAHSYSFPDSSWEQDIQSMKTRTVVGIPEKHTVKDGETLLDIARDYSLGYLDLKRLYPDLDPWLPPVGQELILPRQWVLPATARADIIINLPELRLYHFSKQKTASLVQTFPVGLGSSEKPTPVGIFAVGEKRKTPYWYIPESLQEKYKQKVMAPGPHNPLGDYWIGLGHSSYGLHGTNNPWSVGRLATNGCVRLYPEHIRPLFDQVEMGQKVQLIYEPVKLGIVGRKVYAEAHPDIYNLMEDYLYSAYQKLTALGLSQYVDLQKFRHVLEEKNGMPVNVSKSTQEGLESNN
ncbi:MAG: L,D-transpeptidase family protein [Thermodesulfobacteriota bacterium]